MTFQTKSFTGIQSLARDEIDYILDKAAVMKKALLEKNTKIYRLADNKDLMAASLFYENSTRTRSSFEIAAKKLGMDTVGFVSPESTSVKKGESLKHTLDMFRALMCDAVILRHHQFVVDALDEFVVFRFFERYPLCPIKFFFLQCYVSAFVICYERKDH